ncbi:MAG TPA: TonB family protein [Candidatus Acidoferrales bacterium]|nr:TonB family protein [Candidatus Acidoferrales bacterium]
MATPLDYTNAHPVSDRRAHTRRRISSLAYADLGADNGGIVLDLGEGGMAVQAVVPLDGEPLPRIRFQLPDQAGWIETPGRTAWLSASKRDGGIEFTGLPAEARAKIRAWISAAAAAQEMPKERRVAARSPAEASAAAPENQSPKNQGAEGQPAAAHAVNEEEPAEAALDLMISTAEFSTPHPIAGRGAFAVPSSAMVAPIPAAAPPAASASAASAPATALVEPSAATEPRAPAAGYPRNPQPPLGNIFDRENGPDLRLFGHGMEAALPKQKRNWKGIIVLVIVLGFVSFAAGMEAAEGSLNPALSAIRMRVAGLWVSVSQAASGIASQPSSPAAAPSQPAANAPSPSATAPAASPKPSAPPASPAQASPAQTPPANTPGALPTSSNSAAAPPPSWTNIANNQPAQPTPAASQPSAQPPANAADSGSTAAQPPTPKLDSGLITTAGGITIRSQQLLAIPVNAGYDAGDQTLRLGHLSHRVDPVYPPEAKRDWIEGTVKIRATTAPTGIVDHTEVISGDARLAAAAVTAVRNWRYEPTLLGGQPVATEEEITFVFQLPRTPR